MGTTIDPVSVEVDEIIPDIDRPEGYYWVMRGNDRTIAEWRFDEDTEDGGLWYFVGDYDGYNNDEAKVLRPVV